MVCKKASVECMDKIFDSILLSKKHMYLSLNYLVISFKVLNYTSTYNSSSDLTNAEMLNPGRLSSAIRRQAL